MRHFGVVLALALLAAGCGTLTTKYPVGTTAGLAEDTALVGTWKGHFGGDDQQKPPFYLHFLRSKNAGMFALWVATRLDEDGYGGAIPFKITTATLGPNRYINAVELNLTDPAAKDGRGTIPLLYRSDGPNRIDLLSLSKDQVEKAIRAGKLTGKTTNHTGKDTLVPYDDLQIVSEPAALDAFMATPEAAALFEPWLTLQRAD